MWVVMRLEMAPSYEGDNLVMQQGFKTSSADDYLCKDERINCSLCLQCGRKLISSIPEFTGLYFRYCLHQSVCIEDSEKLWNQVAL